MMKIQVNQNIVVYLKRDYITYGEKLQLQRLILSKLKFNPTTGQVNDFDPTSLEEINKLTIQILVEKMVVNNREITNNFYEEILNLKDNEASKIIEELNKITNPQQNLQEKKS